MADVGVASAEENKLELSDLDANEAENIDSFFLFGCGCKVGPKGTSCSSHINKDLALLSRLSCPFPVTSTADTPIPALT